MQYGPSLRRLICAVALLSCSHNLFAQENNKVDEDNTNDFRLEEVVVTAQKRSENVRDVPMALSVFNGDAMKEAGIFSLDDLARNIPNVSVNDTSNSLYVRGIGTAELNVIGEQAIAYIIDGVYLPKFAYLGAGFLDLERMEVLKGPQGTLFGRNATAGVFNITNGTPSQEWQASALINGGDRDIREGEFMVTGPITDRFAFRIAGKRRKENGSNLSITDNETLGDKDQEMGRVSFRYDFSETTDAAISYTKFKYFHGAFLGYEYHEYPDDLRAAITNLDPNFESVLDRRTSMPRHKGEYEFESRSEGEGEVIPLQINWEWWGHTFTSVTSYARVDTFRGGDVDYTAADLVGVLADISDEQFSQEFRVTSPPGRFEYVAGLYYFVNETDALVQIPLYADFASIATSGTNVLGILDPVALLGGGNTDSERLDNLVGRFSIDTVSIGLFGQLKWAVTDSLFLTIGLRKSEDDKDGEVDGSADGPVPFWTQVTDAPFHVNEKKVDKNLSPKYSISWEPLDEVTLYFTKAKGFRAGSYNVGATEIENVSFDAEKSTTLEAGAKTELLDGKVRWNLGLFHTDYEDYQLSAFTGLGNVTANAPEVEMRGAESDITALLSPGLIARAAVGYNDARFIKHVNGACPSKSITEQIAAGQLGNPTRPRNDCDLSGKGLHRAPRWNISAGIDYNMPLTRFGLPVEVFVGVDAAFKDDEKFDSDLDPIDSEDAYWLFNAKLGVASTEGTWRFAVHGKNLGDELRKTWSGDGIGQPGSHFASTTHPEYYFATLTYRY